MKTLKHAKGAKYQNYLLLGLLLLGLSTGCGSRDISRGESADAAKLAESAEPNTGLSGESRQASEQIPQTPERASDPISDPISEHMPDNEPPESSREIPADTVSILMVGDILLHTPVEESALQPGGNYDFTAIFANVQEEIQAADIAVVNQEVILGGQELGISGYPAFNAPYEAGDALAEAGFDIVCHATNHALDKGKRGLTNCMDFWQTHYPDIAVLGINESEEAQQNIYIHEQNGIRIAFLNYTYGTNGIPLPEDMPYGVNLLDRERVESDLREAEETADFTVVCPHWGTEYSLGISADQRRWTEIFLEGGADLVLGTHPHVIEPVEWVKDEAQDREMLVYYSLGNFVNWTSGTGEGVANRMVGAMAQVTLKREADGKVRIAEQETVPLVCHVEKGVNGVTVYTLADYTEELAAQNAIVNQDPAFSLEYCQQLCETVFDSREQ